MKIKAPFRIELSKRWKAFGNCTTIMHWYVWAKRGNYTSQFDGQPIESRYKFEQILCWHINENQRLRGSWSSVGSYPQPTGWLS